TRSSPRNSIPLPLRGEGWGGGSMKEWAATQRVGLALWAVLAVGATVRADSVAVPEPQGLKQRLVDGALRLGLEDAIQLTLLNSTDVRLSYLDFDEAGYSAIAARRGFDPVATSSFSDTRALSPSASLVEGVPTLSNGDRGANFGLSQTL